MEKPIKQTFKAYIWSQVEEYIKEKHGKELRDWSGHFKDNNKPFQDFWHYLCQKNGLISNGSILQIYWSPGDENYWNPDDADWLDEVYKLFIDEGFLEKTNQDEYVGQFYVQW